MDIGKNRLDIAIMTKIALCVAVLSASSFLIFPLPFTPIVLSVHTIVVNLIGLILKPRHAAYTILIYLFMGFMGIPVFSGGTAGPSKLFGPTGGFYFGFLLAVIVISLLKGKKISVYRYSAVTILAGVPIQHIMAILFMCFYNNFNIKSAVTLVSLPFIPGDIIKCIIASILGSVLNRVLQKY